jgi:multimeric flavodoxin WrbA
VFASPIYFHYISAPLKNIIDRFRSFIHVQITETGLIHTPYKKWNKDFVLLLSMGSSDDSDAEPVIDLFEYMKDVLGDENKLHVVKATRLAVIKQVQKTEEELKELYPKLQLNENLAEKDFEKNQKVLSQCYDLGMKLTNK